MGRRTWIWTLAVLALIAIAALAWFDGGLRQPEMIEQPIDLPASGE